MTRRALTMLRRRLSQEAGYTLIEGLTVLAILGIVLAGLTVMFQAGIQSELRASRELQAQQNARAALDRTPVSSVTVTLPAACPGAATSVVYSTASVAANRYELRRAADAGTPVRVADYLTSSTPFTYYVPASGTLGRLSVDIPVNLNPTDASTLWRLQDDIVLRNTVRL